MFSISEFMLKISRMNGKILIELYPTKNIASNVKTLKKLCMLILKIYEYFCPPLQNETVICYIYYLSFFFRMCINCVHVYL